MITVERVLDVLDGDKEGLTLIDEISSLGDSLDYLNAIGEIEKAFHIEMEDEAVSRFETVGDIVNYVMKAVKV